MTDMQTIAKTLERLEQKMDDEVAAQAEKMNMLIAKMDDLSVHIGQLQSSGGVAAGGSGGGGVGLATAAASSAAEPEEQPERKSAADERRDKRRATLMNKYANEEIFGVKELTEQEKEDKKSKKVRNIFVKRCIIHPLSYFRQGWDMSFIFFGVYIVTVLPYRIAFVTHATLPFIVVDFILDLFFLSDLILNFFTAYVASNGSLITNHKQIALHYARTWLVPDIISSVPVDWLIEGIVLEEAEIDLSIDGTQDFSSLTKLLRVLKCIKFLRLLRVTRAGRYLQRLLEHYSLEVVLNSNVLRLYYLSAFLTLFAHWDGCFQYMLATFDAELTVRNGTLVYDFHPDSWVARMQADGAMNEANKWSWSFFNAFCQMLAISVGVKEPRLQSEMWGSFCSIVFGAVIYALFLASLTTAIAESDYSAKEYRSKLNMVNEYMRYAALPGNLRKQMRDFYELWYPSKRAFDETVILDDLTKPLRAKVALHNCRAVLESLRLVTVDDSSAGAGSHEKMTFLAEAISFHLRRVVYVDGDYIVREGEDSEGMYFISKGYCDVLNADQTVLTTLGNGSFFGEMSLLFPEGRAVASVRVASFCDGYFLSRADFDKLTSMYPTLRETLQTVAKLRRVETIRRQSITGAGPAGVGGKPPGKPPSKLGKMGGLPQPVKV